jgi:hypothetical protein
VREDRRFCRDEIVASFVSDANDRDDEDEDEEEEEEKKGEEEEEEEEEDPVWTGATEVSIFSAEEFSPSGKNFAGSR